MDVHDKQTRSFNMSRIKGKDTKPEEIVRKYLFKQGFRYRKNDKKLPGKPDIVLPKYKTVIFVNGCFWHHHHNCKYATVPKTNPVYWKEKIEKNVENDIKNYNKLVQLDYKVIVIWECEIKECFEYRMNELIKEIKNNYFEV